MNAWMVLGVVRETEQPASEENHVGSELLLGRAFGDLVQVVSNPVTMTVGWHCPCRAWQCGILHTI